MKTPFQAGRTLDPADTLIASSTGECCAVCGRQGAATEWVARFEIKGMRVQVCCPLCAEAFQAAPDEYVARLVRLQYYRELQESRKQTAPSGTA